MQSLKLANKVWRDPVYFFAFGFGSGLIARAPGTWGTLMAIPIYFLIAQQPILIYLLLTLLFFLFGIIISNKVTEDLAVCDYPGIVWDEIVGYLLTMAWFPMDFGLMILGIILFRIFDIWKPMPIRFVDQHLHGGFGVMFDDALAAIFAAGTMQIFIWIFI